MKPIRKTNRIVLLNHLIFAFFFADARRIDKKQHRYATDEDARWKA
jgi:hypothetical protein